MGYNVIEFEGKCLPMIEKHRQQLIKDILDQQQFASVRSLTEKLKASEEK